MKLASLEAAVLAHAGRFYCEQIHQSDKKNIVNFRHEVSAAAPAKSLPKVGRLEDFYDTFGAVVFYVDDISGDAAKHIADPAQWAELRSNFLAWFDHPDDGDLAEGMPEWIDTCLVIGAEPKTGNYLLMPAVGDMAGHVFLFDHDGFELTDCANDLVEYVEKLITPDDQLLLEIATHMRFIEGDPSIQWWIRELRDNRGNLARTYE